MIHIRDAEPHPCPVCGSVRTSEFFFLGGVPLHCNLLWKSREQATSAPRGELRLVFCHACGHVYNSAFEPALMEYTEQYENSLHFSPFFQEYAHGLVQRLMDRYHLRSKHVVEIGCGKGEFLALLCQRGNNRGTGFDPSYAQDRMDELPGAKITFVKDFFSKRHADQAVDLIVCRHVLEHIGNPHHFLADLRGTLAGSPQTAIFFEVPDAMFIIKDLSIWDLIYEHCSYFTEESFIAAFELAGFEVTAVESVFSGQFLTVDAVPCEGPCPSTRDSQRIRDEYLGQVERFAKSFQEKVGNWSRTLQEIHGSGRKAVVWGAGSKGASFLNMVPEADGLEYVVDINPHKQGRYVAGTGQMIVAPEFLKLYRPHVVIVMNPVYLDEMRRMVAAMGLSMQFLTV